MCKCGHFEYLHLLCCEEGEYLRCNEDECECYAYEVIENYYVGLGEEGLTDSCLRLCHSSGQWKEYLIESEAWVAIRPMLGKKELSLDDINVLNNVWATERA